MLLRFCLSYSWNFHFAVGLNWVLVDAHKCLTKESFSLFLLIRSSHLKISSLLFNLGMQDKRFTFYYANISAIFALIFKRNFPVTIEDWEMQRHSLHWVFLLQVLLYMVDQRQVPSWKFHRHIHFTTSTVLWLSLLSLWTMFMQPLATFINTEGKPSFCFVKNAC